MLIGSTKLLDTFQPGSFEDANESFANEEAEALYDEVFYFIEPQNLFLTGQGTYYRLKGKQSGLV